MGNCCNQPDTQPKALKIRTNILVLGATGSGKTELIKQAISCNDTLGYDETNIDETWMKLQYDDGPFIVNQYVPKQLMEYATTNRGNDACIDMESLCSAYIGCIECDNKHLLIPKSIKILIISYCSKPILKSYIANIAGQQEPVQFLEVSEYSMSNWCYLYHKISVVLFTIDSSSYDEYIELDGKQINQMSHSFQLFSSFIHNTGWDKDRAPLLVFWNKSDQFAWKCRRVPITVCPEFVMDVVDDDTDNLLNINDYDALVFMRTTFEGKMNYKEALYSHVTCATDRSCIKRTWTGCMHVMWDFSAQRL
eukprot:1115209_1